MRERPALSWIGTPLYLFADALDFSENRYALFAPMR
jgi:hypothetical protein